MPRHATEPENPALNWLWQYETDNVDQNADGLIESRVIDPLGRLVTTYTDLLGLTRRIEGSSCCGSLEFEYALSSPLQEAQDYPSLIRDAAGRERSLTYYPPEFDIDGNSVSGWTSAQPGSAGQLASATDLGGNVYTFEYRKPNGTTIYDANLEKVIAPPADYLDSGTLITGSAEELVSYGYDSQGREETVTYSGLARPQKAYYETTTSGAAHLPSKIDLPLATSSARIELDYEDNDTGQLDVKRVYDALGNLSMTANFDYNANDSVDKITYDNQDGRGSQVLDYNHDPNTGQFTGITFPTTANLSYTPDGLGRIQKVAVKARPASPRTYEVEYGYDEAGNIDNIRVAVAGGSTFYEFDLTYDAVNRLTERRVKVGATADVLTSTFGYQLPDDSYAPDNFVRTIAHENNSTTIETVTYTREGTGEPNLIEWNDGASVLLGYGEGSANDLRLREEDYDSASTSDDQVDEYDYNAVGSRVEHVVDAGNQETYWYAKGMQLAEVRSGTAGDRSDPAVKLMTHDGGGRLTGIDYTTGSDWTLDCSEEDMLESVTIGSTETTYEYDPDGRRVASGNGTSTLREFVVGPTAGTGLEVLHMVTDGSGNAKTVYVYLGDQPLMRFEVDGSGDPTNPVFYLEDAMGSVLALADATGSAVARFRYDGFGMARTDTGLSAPTSQVPSGVGGDFRFHGMWLEEVTGFYHMRARDYDSSTGRFLTRDPVEAALSAPETRNPYTFADSNGHYFVDPTGGFSLVLKQARCTW